MVVIWRREINHKRYLVTKAGNSIRLYTSGAFHSQYNEARPFAGAVWDSLTLPALYAAQAPRRVLMLGVGGGAAIRQINKVLAPHSITGVELDPIHLYIARRFFRCETANVRLVEGDAVAWTRRSRAKFNWIIDDLFLDATGDPERPIVVNADWLNCLVARLSPGGLLVQNHLSEKAALAIIQSHGPLLRRTFKSALLFSVPAYTNSILALYGTTVRDLPRARRQALASLGQAGISGVGTLKFSVKQVF